MDQFKQLISCNINNNKNKKEMKMKMMIATIKLEIKSLKKSKKLTRPLLNKTAICKAQTREKMKKTLKKKFKVIMVQFN